MDFFSLELSDTNAIDHNTYDYSSQNISFEIVLFMALKDEITPE